MTTFLAGQQYYIPTPLFPRSLEQNLRQYFEFPPSEDISVDTSFAALRYLRALLDLAGRHNLLDDRAADAASPKRKGSRSSKASAQASAAWLMVCCKNMALLTSIWETWGMSLTCLTVCRRRAWRSCQPRSLEPCS